MRRHASRNELIVWTSGAWRNHMVDDDDAHRHLQHFVLAGLADRSVSEDSIIWKGRASGSSGWEGWSDQASSTWHQSLSLDLINAVSMILQQRELLKVLQAGRTTWSSRFRFGWWCLCSCCYDAAPVVQQQGATDWATWFYQHGEQEARIERGVLQQYMT